MIVAVTGASGFIGRRLVEYHLGAGDTVRALSRRAARLSADFSDVEWIAGDLTAVETDLRSLVDRADVLYHCAGELRRTERMQALHVGGTERLLATARGRVGRWVQLSSVGAYGPRRTGVIDELTPPAPVGEYERTKLAADERVLAAGRDGALATVVLRPSIVFGPEMPNQSLFQWITLIARRWFCFVGPSGASANFIDVDNVVDALARCATHQAAIGQVYNLSDWRTVEDFVGAIARALGQPAPRLRVPARPLRAVARLAQCVPGMQLTESRVAALCGRARYPSDKIEIQLQYTHVLTMEAALERMVARWRQTRPEVVA
jgi:nucleoside-diphosphate-sugar epimerase